MPGPGDIVAPVGTSVGTELNSVPLTIQTAAGLDTGTTFPDESIVLVTVGGTSRVYWRFVRLNIDPFIVPDGWVIVLGSREKE